MSDNDYLFWEDEPKKTESTKPTCYGCHRELSKYLDVYYGKDDYWSKYCTPCRDKRLKDVK